MKFEFDFFAVILLVFLSQTKNVGLLQILNFRDSREKYSSALIFFTALSFKKTFCCPWVGLRRGIFCDVFFNALIIIYIFFLAFGSLASLDYVFFYFFFIRRSMVWTEQHDILFLREIMHIHSWIHSHWSVEWGKTRDEIATILHSLEEPFFKVTPRLVRDRYSLRVKKYK